MSSAGNCPGIESWQALLGSGAAADTVELERHLESCQACQERVHRAEAAGGLRNLGRRLGDPTLLDTDPTLIQVLDRLHGVRSNLTTAPVEPADLYFLRPADRAELLGTLGPYEVHEVIGQGGMGVVLKAFEPDLHRLVAIKVMAAAVAGSATARKRFKREAQAAAAVCHDHVVAVHGVHEMDGLPYLVMQHVAGESLQARLDRTGPLELTEIVRIGMQTASGLAAAHAQGLIHRDIKPANLLLENGLARVKITDFGLARMVDEDVGLTQQGVVAGTPEYMAPEQARGEPVDHRADLFSLGSVLYAMCTGVPPFRGATTVALLRQVSDADPTPVRAVNPETPEWLAALIEGLLKKDPALRVASAADVAALLEGYLAHLRQPALNPAPPLPFAHAQAIPTARSFGPAAWLQPALVALFLAASGVGIAFALTGHEEKPQSRFEYSFAGATALGPDLKWYGVDTPSVDTPKHVHFEPSGLRITLPFGAPGQRPGVGIATAFGVRGDFEVTVGFEVLSEIHGVGDRERHTGLSLMVLPENAGAPGPGVWQKLHPRKATLTRGIDLREMSQFCAAMSQWDETAGKVDVSRFVIGAREMKGRLRLTRTGSTLTYAVAEGPRDVFTPMEQCLFGDADLHSVRIVASTGGTACALDVIVTDVHVNGETLPNLSTSLRRLPYRNTILVASAAVSALSLAGWFVVRRRRALPTPIMTAATKVKTAAQSSSISFACSSCGKNLKSKPTLAGKKVKCPGCSQAVLVPEPSRQSARLSSLLVPLMVACTLIAGCDGSHASSAAKRSPLEALEPYNPTYMLDPEGHVVKLKLEGGHVTDAALDEVAKLTQLTYVSLYAASVGDESLAKLQGLKALEYLGLGGTPITDAGLVHLEKLLRLQHLWLPRNQVSEEGIESLKKALPSLTVHFQ